MGEILVYLSFAMTVGKYEAYGICMFIWTTIFWLNMHCKDLSLKMKDGWKEYEQRSWMLIPKILGSTKISTLVYALSFFIGMDLYKGSGFI